MSITALVEYIKNGKRCAAKGDSIKLEESVVLGGKRIKCSFCEEGEVEFVSARLKIPFEYMEEDKILSNGFQSWSRTTEKSIHDKEPRLGVLQRLTDPLFHIFYSGDYIFYDYKNKPGVVHSHSYTYVRRGSEFSFFGTLTERSGYMCFETDTANNTLYALLDIKGHVHTGERLLFDIICLEGGEDEVFDTYFELLGIAKSNAKKLKGFSSWYNYYQNVTQADILRTIDDFTKLKAGCDIIQIDDGYESAVGDWMLIDKNKFPDDFAETTAKIKEHFLAGLWLAPFVCEKKSVLFKEHKDWLLKDEKGRPVSAGINWSGMYALDIYNSEVREYLKTVFDYVFNTLQIDLVKLDFLYAAALNPPKNKTRGEVMCDGMEFLRELCKDKLILGCGVPLGASFGLVDYCRIGADVALAWEDSAVMKMAGNERVSTTFTLGNTIARRQLSGRAFLNDPDIFHIRDDNLHFSENEKDVLRTVNTLLGDVVFTSDDISKYTRQEQHDKLEDSFELADSKLISLEQQSALSLSICYERGGERHTAYINGEDIPAKISGVLVPARSVVTK